MLKTPALLALTLVSAVLNHLAQEGLGLDAGWAILFKPLTTLLIMVYASQRGQGVLRRWVLAGLAFSLIGDIALLWPAQFFVLGLLAFLVAHLAYLWAFSRVQRLASWPWSFFGYGLVAAVILSLLWPGIPVALHVPVTAYVVCLGTMAAQAAVIGWRARDTPDGKRAAVLALGGLLFFISDGCLAINKFAGPVPLASLLVLPTYWSAQWCIASWLAPRAEATAAAPSVPRPRT